MLQSTMHFHALESGSRLDTNLPSYRKVRRVGQGAFGKAYLVESFPSKEHLILKKIPLEKSKPEKRESAVQEALLLRRVSQDCSFIVRFREVFIACRGSQLCLVMEYASGGDLRCMLDARNGVRLPEAEALELGAQVCAALQHCHAIGALHRDIKPDNCFFHRPGGRLMLGDFGISVVLDERTHAQTCIGTPHYLSPEMMKGETYKQTSDIWSFAVMLFEVASLSRPFVGNNICSLALQIVECVPADIINSSGFSPELSRLLSDVMAKTPNRRASATEALETPLLSEAFSRACEKHKVVWSLQAAESARKARQRKGLVDRIRQRVGGEEYADDFEAASDDLSCEEYEPDFENLSDEDAEGKCDLPSDSLLEVAKKVKDLRGQLPGGNEQSEMLKFLERVIHESGAGVD